MGASQGEERHLPYPHVVRQLHGVLVFQQHGEDVPGQIFLGQLAPIHAGNQRPSPGDRGVHVVPLKAREPFHGSAADGLAILGGMSEGGGAAEQTQHLDEPLGLLRRLLWSVDAGEVGGEIDHDAIAEVHDVHLPLGQKRRDGFLERARKYLVLVVAEEVATEDLSFHVAPGSVLLAVQVDEHLAHDHRAFVVKGLTQIFLLQRFVGGMVGLDGDQAHCMASFQKSWPAE